MLPANVNVQNMYRRRMCFGAEIHRLVLITASKTTETSGIVYTSFFDPIPCIKSYFDRLKGVYTFAYDIPTGNLVATWPATIVSSKVGKVEKSLTAKYDVLSSNSDHVTGRILKHAISKNRNDPLVLFDYQLADPSAFLSSTYGLNNVSFIDSVVIVNFDSPKSTFEKAIDQIRKLADQIEWLKIQHKLFIELIGIFTNMNNLVPKSNLKTGNRFAFSYPDGIPIAVVDMENAICAVCDILNYDISDIFITNGDEWDNPKITLTILFPW